MDRTEVCLRIRYLAGLFCIVLMCLLSTGCKMEKTAIHEIDLEDTQLATDRTKDTKDGTLNEKETEEQKKTKDEKHAANQTDTLIYIYVCGAVENPGVYEMEADARVYEAIEKAGGMTDKAAKHSCNQAEKLTDGQQIYIPTLEEADAPGGSANLSGGSIQGTGAAKVNLNKATAEELMSLPGIGQSKANSILAYRQEHGRFQSIEELKNISGIKEGVFEKIKDQIAV